MAKGFTEHEKELIKEKLIQVCKESWSRYGYAKSNIRDICARAGISTGAFYEFYPSKEHLFVDTSEAVAGSLVETLKANMPPVNPSKYDFAKALKCLIKELMSMEWFLKLHEEMDIISRKLPLEFFEKAKKIEVANFSSLIKQYGFKSKIKINITTAVLRTLLTLLHNRKLIGENCDEAFDFVFNTTIENLFE